MLVEDRRKLVDDQTAYSNQLRAKLKLYFPQAVRWLPELHSRLTGEFLRRWPTLPSLQKARLETIRRFFHQHHCRSEELMRQRLQEIPQAVAATQDAAGGDAGTAMGQALLHLIAVLRAQNADFDRQIGATAAIQPRLPPGGLLPGAP